MNIKQLSLAAAVSALTFTTATNAVLGPIPIYLNTEYRTNSPIIGSIASTIKLNKEQIDATGAKTFLQLLASIPSLNLEAAQGNIAAVRIRGNDARHTLLLVDGVKVDQFGQPNFDVISFDQIQRLEISKGPFSSLYGSGAIGGVVHVFTNQEITSEEATTVSASYGTNNTKKISLSSSFNEDGNYVNYNFSDYHTDGIDVKNNGDLDYIDRTTGSLNIGVKLSDLTNVKFGISATDAVVLFDNGTSNKNLDQVTFEVNHHFSENVNSKFSYGENEQMLYGTNYKTTDTTILNDIKLSNGLIVAGLTKNNDKNLTTGTHNTNIDVFGQWQGSFDENELSLGLRHTDHDRFSTHDTYNINWAKNINNNLRVNASYGKATKLPSLSKTDTNIKDATSTHLAGNNTGLKPEKSTNFELGIEKQYTWGSISAKVYKNNIDDFFKYNYERCLTGVLTPANYDNWPTIVPAVCSDQSLIAPAYYSNDGKYNIKGIDLALNNSIKDWDINSEYSYNKAIKSGTNYQRGRVPQHSLSITGVKQEGKFTHRVNSISKSSAWDTNSGSDKLAKYTLINLSTSYTYKKDVDLSLQVNNATDKKYEVAKGYNQLGRTITLSVTHNF
jgi:vitamin B12 transporter